MESVIVANCNSLSLSRFGFFGTTPDKISNSGMNYAGVALAFGSILLYVMVKNEVSGSAAEMEIIVNVNGETEPLVRPVSFQGFF